VYSSRAATLRRTIELGRGGRPADEWLARRVDEPELSVRTMHALQSLGITTIAELVQRSERDLQANGVGPKSIRALKEILPDLRLWLAMER
jgi:DNA-directed RNA polymerase alpha subunit